VTELDAGLSVRAFFTSRDGGASEGPYAGLNVSFAVGDDSETVAENRKTVARLAGAPTAYMSQVHGATVAVVLDASDAPEADAIITTTPGLALAVAVADCVPILAHELTSGAVAAIHAGRRGVEAGVVGAAIAALRGAAPGDAVIEASVGPAICGACYEVPLEMREAVALVVPQARATSAWGTPSLDLGAAVEAQLRAAGVERVHRVGGCTRESPDLYSHRRDGVTGRFAGVIRCETRPSQ